MFDKLNVAFITNLLLINTKFYNFLYKIQLIFKYNTQIFTQICHVEHY